MSAIKMMKETVDTVHIKVKGKIMGWVKSFKYLGANLIEMAK